MSRAADQTLATADLALLQDRRVYLEEKYFDATDGKYALGAIRDYISLAGGLKSMVFGGEGLFLATLSGTGKVWIQSLPFARIADRILSQIPVKDDES